MIKKCCGNDVAAFAKLSHVTLYPRTATNGNMSMVEKGFFAVATYWRTLIFVDLWSHVVWGTLWHRYHRIICANVGKNQPQTLTSFIIVGSFFTTYSGRFCTMWKSKMLKLSFSLLVGTWLSFPRDFLHQKSTQLLTFSAIWHRREM